MWSVQLRIALEQLAGGLERQKRFTAAVRRIFSRGLLGFVAYHTSVRNEDKTTLGKFVDEIRTKIDRHPFFSSFVKTYANYRLANFWPDGEAELADILRVEQSHSIIDVYETFVATVQEIVRREQLAEMRSVVARCLTRLSAINDFRIAKAHDALDVESIYWCKRNRSTAISDALLGGNAKRAAILARSIVDDAGLIDPWQIIYAGCAFAQSNRFRFEIPHRPRDYPQLIGIVLRRHSQSEVAFTQLEKSTINLKGLAFANALTDFVRQIRPTNPDSLF
jgi:hypothetical protein